MYSPRAGDAVVDLGSKGLVTGVVRYADDERAAVHWHDNPTLMYMSAKEATTRLRLWTVADVAGPAKSAVHAARRARLARTVGRWPAEHIAVPPPAAGWSPGSVLELAKGWMRGGWF